MNSIQMKFDRVTVTREGNFTRNGVDEVDEAEIFEGAENRLTTNIHHDDDGDGDGDDYR